MSYRSHSHHPNPGQPTDHWAYEYPRGHQDPYQAHAPQPRTPAQEQPQKPRRRVGSTDYTLVHGGRQVRLGPVAFWIVVGSLVVMAGWSIVTGTYFAFHDDVLKRLIARQAEMQYAYEDRIPIARQGRPDLSRQLLDGTIKKFVLCANNPRWSNARRRLAPCPISPRPVRFRGQHAAATRDAVRQSPPRSTTQ
jgi:hypothetical protein